MAEFTFGLSVTAKLYKIHSFRGTVVAGAGGSAVAVEEDGVGFACEVRGLGPKKGDRTKVKLSMSMLTVLEAGFDPSLAMDPTS